MAEKKKRGLFSWLGFGRNKQEEQEEMNRAAELARLEAKEKIKTLLDETHTAINQEVLGSSHEKKVDLAQTSDTAKIANQADPQLKDEVKIPKTSLTAPSEEDQQETITDIKGFSAHDLDEPEHNSIKEAANLTEKVLLETKAVIAEKTLTQTQEEEKPEKARAEEEKAARLARLMAEAEAHARKEAEQAQRLVEEEEKKALEAEATSLQASAKAKEQEEKAKRLAEEAAAKALEEKALAQAKAKVEAEQAAKAAAEAKAQEEKVKRLAEEAEAAARALEEKARAEAKAKAEAERAARAAAEAKAHEEEVKQLAEEAKAKQEKTAQEEISLPLAGAESLASGEITEAPDLKTLETKEVSSESVGERDKKSVEIEQEKPAQTIIDKESHEDASDQVHEAHAIEVKAKARAEEALRLAAATKAKAEAVDALHLAVEAEKKAKVLIEEAQAREIHAKALADEAKARAEEAQLREAEALRLSDEAKSHADEEEVRRLAAEAGAKALAEKAQSIEEEGKIREAEALRLANIAKTQADKEEALRLAAEANAKALRERVQIREGEAQLREAEALRAAEEAKAHADEEEALRLAAEAKAKALAEKAHNLEIQAREAEALRLAAEAKAAAHQAFDAGQHEIIQPMPETQGVKNNISEQEVGLMTAENKNDTSQDEAHQDEVHAQAKEKPKRDGFFTRLKQGLLRTKANFSSGFFGLLRGKKIDQDLFEQLEEQLLIADVGIETSNKIITRLTEKASRKQLKDGEALYGLLKEELAAILSPVDKPLELTPKKPFVILMVGVNGVGKTTTIGKLAKQFQQEGKSVMLAAGDTFRAAAVEQLQAWGERNKVPVISQHTGADSASVIFDAIAAAKARNVDVIIADTAGRLQNKANLMEELSKIIRVMKKIDPKAPHEIMLTLDAGTGQNAISQARLFNEIAPLTGITITKLDGTAKGGVIFAIADLFNIPIRYIGVGEAIDDLRPFVADEFVDALFSQED